MPGNFKVIMIVVFVVCAVFGLFVFSGAIPIGGSSTSTTAVNVTLWGTVPSQDMMPIVESFNLENPNIIVKYVQKYPETFDQDLLEAMASGVGPDMFFLSNDLVYKYKNKIFTIPYSSYPLATFKNTFASAGEVFLTSEGMMAFPLTVDPMMMYYNRSMLNTNNITYPPANWNEVQNISNILTKKDATGKITKSAVAMGQFANIKNAKDILSTLFIQSGNLITREENGSFISDLGASTQQKNLGGVLKFFTDFANPLSSTYSWNRSFTNSDDSFSAENLALYFGYSSELASFVKKNPNQDFMIAPIPQIKDSSYRVTSARVTGIAITSSSKNFNTAFTAASLMTTGSFASKFANATMVAPARRDLLNIQPTDAYFPIIYSSALSSKSWIDPSTSGTDNIFKNMIEGVLSNNMTIDEAIGDANAKLDLLLR